MDLAAAAQALAPTLIAWRRHLHRHPEPSFAEHATLAYLEGELKAMGLTPRRLAGGLVADLDGARPGARIALRAEMDGLPLTEETGLPYASERPGLMHACGHDGHMAMVLGAARLVLERQGELAGGVRLLFQPAEERPPGGALGMVRAGALEGVAAVLGLHLKADLPTGTVQLTEGPQMANADLFRIEVKGRGGHGSAPHQTVDAVLLACHLVEHLQTVVSRRMDPLWPVVVSVGSLQAGTAPNIIAERAELTGTVRTLTAEAQAAVRREMERVVEGVARLEGGEAHLEYTTGYPAVVNPRGAVTRVVAEEAAAVVGRDRVVEGPPWMGGEDFAYYQRERPAPFWFLGCGGPGAPPHHSPHFVLEEAALPLGAAILAAAALRLAAEGVPEAHG